MPELLVAPICAGSADWQRASNVRQVRLTSRQMRILDFIRAFQRAHGKTPTYREIGVAVFLARASVAYQVHRLQQLGMLDKPGRQPRAIRLTGLPVSLDTGQ